MQLLYTTINKMLFYLAFLNSGSHYGTMTIKEAVGVGIGIYVDEATGKTFCAMVLVAPF